MSTRKSTAMLLGLACASVMMAGGCKSVKKSDYNAAIEENTKLRERVATLQDKVRQSNEQVEAAERSKQDALSQQQAMYQSQLDAARAQQNQYVTPVNQVSGFEGIPGVATSVPPVMATPWPKKSWPSVFEALR